MNLPSFKESHDAISKAKKQLFEFEQKCGFINKTENLKAKLCTVKELLNKNQIQNAILLLEEIENSI